MRASLLILLLSALPIFADNPPVTIAVDAAAGRHPISPLIYGVAYASQSELQDLNCPLHRLGGNNTSRYNWELNADNRDFDWYFESIPYPDATPGEVGDTFISTSRAGGAEPMITIPMIDWIANVGQDRSKLASFSIAKYGPQTDNDWQWMPDAGNGILLDGNYVINDPNDASVPSDVTFQKGWVDHLIQTWGTANNGGLRYYLLDNESSIWFSTHRDAHPVGATMDEILAKMIDFADMIKTDDPSALVVGPEEWGWSGYFYSGYDQQYGSQHGWDYLPDRENHGGWDYLPWLLDQLRQQEPVSGKRLLDVFTVHFYPQGGEFSNDTSAAMQLRRNRSTRSLWDPNYIDDTWINDTVRLVPRIKDWVNNYYPGTQTGITEYNWGAENHINGATAQADILGIFGREGLDMAARWTSPDPSTPAYKAIKMFRNYDGSGSTFGETSVSTAAPNPDVLAAFGAVRASDGALTLMLISKYLSQDTPASLALANFQASGTAEIWQLTSANAITRLPDIHFSGTQVNLLLPPQSITLLVIPTGSIVPTYLLFDDFENGVQEWSVRKGQWTESGGALNGAGAPTAIAFAPAIWNPSGVSECSLCTADVDLSLTGGQYSKLFLQHWYQDRGNRVDVIVKEDSDVVILRQFVGGRIAGKQKLKIPIDPNVVYNVRVSYDGANFWLLINNADALVLPAHGSPHGTLGFKVKNTNVSIPEVRVLKLLFNRRAR